MGGSIRQGRSWTTPNGYTGGDIQPLPTSGGIIYTKYTYDPNQNRVGQLWFTNRAGSAGRALTSTAAGCAQPSLSPDGHSIAMICTYQKQVSYLTIASWNGTSLGPLQTVVSDQLVAQRVAVERESGVQVWNGDLHAVNVVEQGAIRFRRRHVFQHRHGGGYDSVHCQ